MVTASHWKLGGLSYFDLAKRVYNEIWTDDVLGSAAQLAYYFLFALFPLLIFLTSIFGFIVGSDEQLRNELFRYLGTVLPGSASDLIKEVITQVSESSSSGKLTFGLFFALFFASSGMEAVTQSVNKIYGVEETRSLWWRKLLALFLTIILAVVIIAALIVVIFGGQIANYLTMSFGLGEVFSTIWNVAQWLVVLAFVTLVFSLIYYFSPDIREQKWYFITPGAVVGVLLWLLVSFALRLYLSYFNSYDATYGSLGAVIILMLWLYLTGAAILIGGEINSEIENAAAQAGAPDARKDGERAPGDDSTAIDKSSDNGKAAQPKNAAKNHKAVDKS